MKSPRIIGIVGASGSGKTTVAKELAELAGSASLMSQDNYYISLPDGVDSKDWNFDDPAVIDLEHLARNLAALKRGERDEVIEELCQFAANQDDMTDADSVRAAVLKRENEMGTGLEEGIAVPHARLAGIRRPMVIFGRSSDGVEWNSPDGKPARFIFLILTPEDDYDTQVQVLGAIARTMSDQQVRSAMINAADSHAIWAILEKHFIGKHVIKNSKKIKK